MSIRYDKLFEILKERGHSSNYWLRQNGIHSATASKLRKNERVNTDTINTICKLLNVQPGDIMEYVPDDESIKPIFEMSTSQAKINELSESPETIPQKSNRVIKNMFDSSIKNL